MAACSLSLVCILLLIIPSISGDCSYSSCRRRGGARISFPFRSPDQPITCGLPGFDLGCNLSAQTPLISFPPVQYSFSVEQISYSSKYIYINDPQMCLPKKLLQNYLNTSGTPFRVDSFTNFSLYSCSSLPRPPRSPYYRSDFNCSTIECGGGPPYSVVCFPKGYPLLNDGCVFVGATRIPGRWPYPFMFTGKYQSLRLEWEMPSACRRCRGKCTRKNATQIKCNVFTPGVIAAVTISAIIVVVVVIYMYCKCRRRRRASITSTSTSSSSSTTEILSSMRANANANANATNTSTEPPDGHPNWIFVNRFNRPQSNVNTVASTSSMRATPTNTPTTEPPAGHPNWIFVTNRNVNAVASPRVIRQDTLDTYPVMVVGESGRMLINMEDKTCVICLSDYASKEKLKLLPECLHKFHAHCIDEWLRANPTCPICRTPPPRTSS